MKNVSLIHLPPLPSTSPHPLPFFLCTQVLNQTTDHRHRVLAAAAKHLRTWFIKVKKIKAIYHTLNMLNLDVTNKCLIAECWIPTRDMGAIRQALIKGTVGIRGSCVCMGWKGNRMIREWRKLVPLLPCVYLFT